jgi:hypothetical protein
MPHNILKQKTSCIIVWLREHSNKRWMLCNYVISDFSRLQEAITESVFIYAANNYYRYTCTGNKVKARLHL